MTRRLLKLLTIVGSILTAQTLCPPRPAFAHSSSAQLQASAVIPASRGTCSFDIGGPYVINFASPLNPLAPILATASTTFNVTCVGITGEGGKTVVVDTVGSGPFYLKNGNSRIPYTLSLPSSQYASQKQSEAVTVTATIQAADYVTAPLGDYSDTVTLYLLP